MDKTIVECGCCGAYHPVSFRGDCRDDANRYPSPEEYAAKTGFSVHDLVILEA